MRVIFLAILILHGLIHLMGFAKAFRTGEINQLTLNISRPAGVAWLTAVVLLLGTSAAFALHMAWWWMAGIPALLLSQVLIIIYWSDARVGTIGNLVLLAGLCLGFGTWQFHTMVQHELRTFLPVKKTEVNGSGPHESLPASVQKWLERVHAGNGAVHTVYIKQKGMLRPEVGGSWYPFEAEQWTRLHNPGFIWTVKMSTPLGTYVEGRDRYADGRGSTLIKLLALFPVTDAHGPATDQGAMQRYLAEVVWYPPAALNHYVQWQAVDSLTARASMHYKGNTASALFHFNNAGDVVRISAQRYYYRPGGSTTEPWVVEVDETSYREIQGYRVPTKVSVTWKLREGDYHWYDTEVTEIRFNK